VGTSKSVILRGFKACPKPGTSDEFPLLNAFSDARERCGEITCAVGRTRIFHVIGGPT
jgi:hypothetical protein